MSLSLLTSALQSERLEPRSPRGGVRQVVPPLARDRGDPFRAHHDGNVTKSGCSWSAHIYLLFFGSHRAQRRPHGPSVIIEEDMKAKPGHLAGYSELGDRRRGTRPTRPAIWRPGSCARPR